MNIIGALLIKVGFSVISKEDKIDWIVTVAKDINKSMTDECIKLGMDTVEVEKMIAMIKYVGSLQNRLKKE